jgi:hypothetical protein
MVIEINDALEAIKVMKHQEPTYENQHESMLVTLRFLKKLGFQHVSLGEERIRNNR